MRKFLAPWWPSVTAESRVAEGKTHHVSSIQYTSGPHQLPINWPNISNRFGTLSLNLLQCLMPPITAVRILREFSKTGFVFSCTHTKAELITNIISKPFWIIFLYNICTFSTWTFFCVDFWVWLVPLFPSEDELCDPKLFVNFREFQEFWGCAVWTKGLLADGTEPGRGLLCWHCVEPGGLSDFWPIWENPEWDADFIWALL